MGFATVHNPKLKFKQIVALKSHACSVLVLILVLGPQPKPSEMGVKMRKLYHGEDGDPTKTCLAKKNINQPSALVF